MSYDLDRFKEAQENSYPQALKEMQEGLKRSHWMWYIFPQIAGLGKSSTAQYFSLANLEEATLYLEDELLSERLLHLTRILVNEVNDKIAEDIFGFPDYLKFHSCMTLFHYVVQSQKYFKNAEKFNCFHLALLKYFDGELDQMTLELL